MAEETPAQVKAREASRAAWAEMVAQNEADITAAVGAHVDGAITRELRRIDAYRAREAERRRTAAARRYYEKP